jgi:hypothetical protein
MEYLLSAKKSEDGNEHIVSDLDKFLFINNEGILESFGSGDFNNFTKIKEAELVPIIVENYDADLYTVKSYTDKIIDGIIYRKYELIENTINIKLKEYQDNLTQLATLDQLLPRCVEDIIDVLCTEEQYQKLPNEFVDRLKEKQRLRNAVREYLANETPFE